MSAHLTGIGYVVYPHILPAHDASKLGALETCVHVLRTCVPSYTIRPARLFFMLEAHGAHRSMRHMVALKLTSVRK
jgi:hypothetical protein